jgi:hypothetical protein
MILPSLAPAQWAGAFFVRSIFASPASPLSFNIDELRDLNVFNSVQFSFSTLTASGGGEGVPPFSRATVIEDPEQPDCPLGTSRSRQDSLTSFVSSFLAMTE